jgi:serine/threonine-protein kinase
LRIAPVGTFGRYQILGRIALGGMAEIFLARQRAQAGASRTLVIKRVLPHVADDERFVQMFLDEARLAMKLTHPNICHIYEFGQQNGNYFIAMEWIDGVPLGRLIKTARKQYGAVPPGISARIIATTAEALDYAHNARDDNGTPLSVIHRDVSPQNIMVSFQGVVKLLDFGIAKAASHLAKTSDGQVKGKFAYMSPEQCRGEPIDGRSDVFALGICLYEALTARNLYKRSTEYETFRAIIEGPVPSAREKNPDVPEALDRILRTALAKDPDDRYPTAGAMQRALEGWLAETRQVINASTTSQLMGLLFADDIQTGPSVEPVPFGGGGMLDQDEVMSAAPGQEQPRQSVLPIAFLGALVVLLSLALAAGGIWAFTRPEPLPEVIAIPTPRPETETETEAETAAETEAETAAETETAAESGTLRITTRPSGARIRLDGEEVEGETPSDLGGLPVGEHALELRVNGYRTHRERVEIVAGETAEVSARLRRRRGHRGDDSSMEESTAEGQGTLAINTRPWSKVYASGRLLGTTPLRTTVPAGTLRLRLEDRDGTEHQRTVRVSEDEETRVFFDLADRSSE